MMSQLRNVPSHSKTEQALSHCLHQSVVSETMYSTMSLSVQKICLDYLTLQLRQLSVRDCCYSNSVYFTNCYLCTDTTDVQWASVEQLDNSSLLLMCVFAEGSRARGCQLTIKLSSTEKVQIIVQLHRTNHSAKIRELYENHVDWGESPSVVARDIEADGTIAENGLPGDVTVPTARNCKETSP